MSTVRQLLSECSDIDRLDAEVLLPDIDFAQPHDRGRFARAA